MQAAIQIIEGGLYAAPHITDSEAEGDHPIIDLLLHRIDEACHRQIPVQRGPGVIERQLDMHI